MDIILQILEAAAKAGPLIVSLVTLGGLAFIIYTMAQKTKDYDQKYDTITGNHLHELPDIAEGIKSLNANVEKLYDCAERQERTLVALDSYLRARLNGGK